jgi:hypothetical protein
MRLKWVPFWYLIGENMYYIPISHLLSTYLQPIYQDPGRALVGHWLKGWLDGWMVKGLKGWMVGWLNGWMVKRVGWLKKMV